MWSASFDPLRFDEAYAFFEQLTPMTRDEAARLSRDARRRAFWVSHVAEADVIASVFDSLQKAIDNGMSYDEWRGEIGGELLNAWVNNPDGPTEPMYRMETIFRTNLQTAYSAGRLAAQRDPAVLSARPYWRYDALIDGRESDVCRRLNDAIVKADDPWWATRYPPNHYNCRSTVRSLSEAQVRARGGPNDEPPMMEGDDQWRTMPSLDAPAARRYPDPIGEILRGKINATP